MTSVAARCAPVLLTLLGALPAVALDYSFVVSGAVVDTALADAVDDVRDFDVVISDSAGTEIAAFSATDVLIIAGSFVIPVDDATADLVAAAAAAGRVDVNVATVDDAGAPLSGTATLDAAATARFAINTDETPFAQRAARLGPLVAADVAGAAELFQASRGIIPIALGNVVDIPAGVADGVDNGNVDVIGTGLVRTGTALDVASGAITSAVLQDGTVGSAAIADGAVTSTVLSDVSGTDFANGSLTNADFASTTFNSGDVAGTLTFVFQSPLGCDTAQLFVATTSTSSTCTKRTGCSAGQVRNCATGACETGTVTTCARTRLGATLFAP